MDALLSGVASQLIGRLMSFLIGKYKEHGGTDDAVRLQRALLRARVVVEEAEGRQMANPAMMQQLNQLRWQLCQAVYALEAFRWRATDPGRSRRSYAMEVSRSPLHTRLAPISDCSEFLPSMAQSLEATLSDMREFVVLLNGCPRVTRQPYSAYLLMERCMFGRQMENEEIISLSKNSQDLDVLPIIGPPSVGKQTLVEHLWLDERVRKRFSKIHRLRSDGLDDLHTNEYHHQGLFYFTERSLIVIDMVDGDADAEESWKAFHSRLLCRHAHKGNKIIVLSRTEAHSSLGTVPPLRLCAPRREELWYFFRTLAFGGADPDDRPDLARIAMALCEAISNYPKYNTANLIASSLRADLSTHFWRRVLKIYTEATVLQLGAFGDGFDFDEDTDRRSWLSRLVMNTRGTPFLFYNRRRLNNISPRELPKVTLLELLTGCATIPVGETRFDVLMWQSHIPPYGRSVATCDVGTPRTRRGKRKRQPSPARPVSCNKQPSILCPSCWGCVPQSGWLLVFFPY